MTKKHFIAFADAIREHNKRSERGHDDPITDSQLDMLARFCKSQNHAFNWDRWIYYIKGECVPNGGAR